MALILIIETATPHCSVAVSEDGKIITLRESSGQNDHAAVLAVFIKDILQQAPYSLNDLNAIAVSKGPGSYTGLRIGVSTAKGLSYSLDKPLIGLNTLEGMAYGMIHQTVRDRKEDMRTLFCPMIDARRMEVYCAVFDDLMHVVSETSAEIINEHSFADLLSKKKIIFFGDGADKIPSVLGHQPHANIIHHFHPSASNFGVLAENLYQRGAFEDVVYFEPYYLKQFVAGKPRVKGLE